MKSVASLRTQTALTLKTPKRRQNSDHAILTLSNFIKFLVIDFQMNQRIAFTCNNKLSYIWFDIIITVKFL